MLQCIGRKASVKAHNWRDKEMNDMAIIPLELLEALYQDIDVLSVNYKGLTEDGLLFQIHGTNGITSMVILSNEQAKTLL